MMKSQEFKIQIAKNITSLAKTVTVFPKSTDL